MLTLEGDVASDSFEEAAQHVADGLHVHLISGSQLQQRIRQFLGEALVLAMFKFQTFQCRSQGVRHIGARL